MSFMKQEREEYIKIPTINGDNDQKFHLFSQAVRKYFVISVSSFPPETLFGKAAQLHGRK